MERKQSVWKLFSLTPFQLRLMLIGMLVALLGGNAQALIKKRKNSKSSLHSP